MAVGRYMTQTQYAKRIGVSQPRVAALMKSGRLDGALVKQGKRRKIDWKKADAILDAEIEPQKEAKADTGGNGSNASYWEHRTRREKWRAAIDKLTYQTKSKELVSITEVNAQAFKVYKAVRTQLEAIGNKVAPELTNIEEPAPIAALINREIKTILENLSRELEK